MTIPFSPQPVETMRARFAAALVGVMLSGDDPRVQEPSHFFDFDDGYRLIITRDRVEAGDVILVCGGLSDGSPWPVTLRVARVALHFSELTDVADLRYGQGEVVQVDHACVMMAYKYEE